MALDVRRRQFTVADYHRMAASGVLAEDDRVELVDGEVVEMSPIGSRHAACVARLSSVLSAKLATSAVIWVQNPVRLDERTELQPDVALLRPRDDFYAGGHPGPADVLLLVEVADTSADYDRQVKVPRYARAGISEVWLVDLTQRQVTVYRQPATVGYGLIRAVAPGENLSPAAFPDLSLLADQVLG